MPDRPADARKPPSLDETIAESAVILSDQIQTAAAWAKSEMDLQIEVAGALKEFARKAKISLEGHHNVTIATGRTLFTAVSSSNTKPLARCRRAKTPFPTRP